MVENNIEIVLYKQGIYAFQNAVNFKILDLQVYALNNLALART